MEVFLFLLITSLLPSSIFANLVLTYPQARFPPLDFLPADMTQVPCGVPKPTKPFYTTMHIGDQYNVTWITPAVSNSIYRIRLIDSDGLTVEQMPESMAEHDERSSYQMLSLKSPCEQCMLLVEQTLSNGKKFRTCADVNIVRAPATDEEACNGRGSVMEKSTKCQCESGFTGDQCQHYAHCESNDDCLNGGICAEQHDSLIKKRCFCSYGFFGQRCDQKFNSQNDHCFAYDEIVAMDLPRFGMFNPRCYKRYDLSADDQLYSRRVDNEIEIIMDFATDSWLSLGWRPTELSTSCRLFPILEDTRGRRGGDEMDEQTRRQFVAKPVMPKNNGFTEMGLKSPLHAMDCIDMVMGLVRKGRLFISDYYSRDRSTPLEDYWYEGEMSLSAAYGTEVDGRTIIMFRREMREFEPTDHPLGPNDVFVVWAKGENSNSDEFRYHGTNRGVQKLKLSETINVTFEEQPRPSPPKKPISNEIAFGIKNVIQDRLTPMSILPTTSVPTPVVTTTTTTTNTNTRTASTSSTTTTTDSPTDSNSRILPYFSIITLFIHHLLL